MKNFLIKSLVKASTSLIALLLIANSPFAAPVDLVDSNFDLDRVQVQQVDLNGASSLLGLTQDSQEFISHYLSCSCAACTQGLSKLSTFDT